MTPECVQRAEGSRCVVTRCVPSITKATLRQIYLQEPHMFIDLKV
jgi:hypothetical protein